MPGKIKVRIICARNLPIMDRSSDSSDAFVEVRFGNNHYDKTPVYKKSLDPEWNSRFVFEVEEDEIQEEPLQIRVLDHDTYSSHDAIGKVYIDLKPLLNSDGPSAINGWFPIYDTMHGIRGEIKVQAKVEIINDFNEYRKSSCGVQFFCSLKVPDGYVLQNFHGFVEELVINDDPEYQWIDKIRTPRTSNETRQKLFSKLSGEMQRRIGLKVREMGANCVLGYMQNFDLEGEHGIVVRGIGTAANIYKYNHNPLSQQSSTNMTPSILQTPPLPQAAACNSNSIFSNAKQAYFNNANVTTASINSNISNNINQQQQQQQRDDKSENSSEKQLKKLIINNNNTNNINNQFGINTNGNVIAEVQQKLNKLSPSRTLPRIHSDSDINTYQHHQQLIHTNQIQDNLTQLNQPKNQSQTSQLQQQQSYQPLQQQQPSELPRQSVLDKLEYPFLTIQQYPIGFIKALCGIVCARSVKLLSSTTSEEDLDARDKWWIEIRNEIRCHMKALNCHVVLGYNETKSICEDVCVLSASGTAAIVDETFFLSTNLLSSYETSFDHINNFSNISIKSCKICHVPYNENDLPFPIGLSPCAICGVGLVPDIIFTSIQPMPEIETIGQGCLLRAIVTRPRKKCTGEISAKIISDYLPFMEYELHRQLLGKLKLKGMNMLYGLRIQISIGENLLTGIAEATACYAAPLPQPIIPKIMSEKSDKTNKEIDEIDKLTKLFKDEMNKNKIFFNLNSPPKSIATNKFHLNSQNQTNSNSITNNESELINNHPQQPQVNDSKSLFKIELDDIRDKDDIIFLFDSNHTQKKGFYACSTEYMPGIGRFNENLQMFTSVFRCETSLVQMNTAKFNEICDEIIKTLQFKFRKFQNYCLSNLSFDNSLYDDDHAMIIITGCCLTFSDLSEANSSDSNSTNGKLLNKPTNEESSNSSNSSSSGSGSESANMNQLKSNMKRNIDKGVEISNLSYVPNAQIESYFGHVNLFLIRESTQIKENGGLSGFMHCFISEVLALSRAHVLSLGGNALVSFKMNECVLLDNPHRNQGQCLINVSGDAVKVVQKCSV